MGISIGRDHEFRHILYAQSASHHVLFCSVCDSQQDTHGDWITWMSTHKNCPVANKVERQAGADALPAGELASVPACIPAGERDSK